jgi:hypothetical protein
VTRVVALTACFGIQEDFVKDSCLQPQFKSLLNYLKSARDGLPVNHDNLDGGSTVYDVTNHETWGLLEVQTVLPYELAIFGIRNDVTNIVVTTRMRHSSIKLRIKYSIVNVKQSLLN